MKKILITFFFLVIGLLLMGPGGIIAILILKSLFVDIPSDMFFCIGDSINYVLGGDLFVKSCDGMFGIEPTGLGIFFSVLFWVFIVFFILSIKKIFFTKKDILEKIKK